MEFDKSRVYTALNADELKVGDMVILGDTLKLLKEQVEQEEGIVCLGCIDTEAQQYRFLGDNCPTGFLMAYLVERAKEKKWRAYKNCDEMVEDFKTRFSNSLYHSEYTVKYNANPMWHPMIWVKHKVAKSKGVITNCFIRTVEIHGVDYDTDELFNHYTYLDDTPCGILEE